MKGIYTRHILCFEILIGSNWSSSPCPNQKCWLPKSYLDLKREGREKRIIREDNRTLSPNEKKFYPLQLMWCQGTCGTEWINVSFTHSFIWRISDELLYGGAWVAKWTSFSWCPLGVAGRAHCLYLKLWFIKICLKRALWIVFIDRK